MGTKREQGGNKNSKVGQEREQSDTRISQWGKNWKKKGAKWEQELESGARMGRNREQNGNKNSKVWQEWDQNGNKVGTRTPKRGKTDQSGNKMGLRFLKWGKNGNKVGTRIPKWGKNGNKVGTKWQQEFQNEPRM